MPKFQISLISFLSECYFADTGVYKDSRRQGIFISLYYSFPYLGQLFFWKAYNFFIGGKLIKSKLLSIKYTLKLRIDFGGLSFHSK